MSEYLGFKPTSKDDFYFLSYGNLDKDRVGNIAGMLAEKLPIWYDYGIPYGEKWEEEISVRISKSKAVLLFFTRSILFKDESWVLKEFRIAKRIDKKIFVIMLDQVADREVPETKLSYWDDILQLQSIILYKSPPEQATGLIYKAVSSWDGSVSGRAGTAAEPVQAPEPEITEDLLEPDVAVHILPLPVKSGPFKKGPSKADLLPIRQDNKNQLTQIRDRLQEITAKKQPDAAEAYRCARTAMILVTKQLGAYDWEYKLERKIQDFEEAYERNLTEIRHAILSGKRDLSDRGVVLVKQILFGLNEIIELL